jgi:hypothetical protein
MKMANFENLKKLDVTKDKTATYTIGQVIVNDQSPILTVAPATEANKGYFNALLKRASKSARQVAAGKVSAVLIAENRDEDRALYPSYIVKNWSNVFDSSGDEVPFSKEACEEFLEALPDWLFDDLRNFCGKPDNFVDATALNGLENVAKN